MPPTDAHRRFRRVVALAPRHGGGIEQQQEVDVGRIIELAAAKLAERENGDALDLCARNALRQRCFERLLDGRSPRNRTEACVASSKPSSPAKVAQRNGQRHACPAPAKLAFDRIAGRLKRLADTRGALPCSTKVVTSSGRRGSRLSQEWRDIPAPGAARRSGRRCRQMPNLRRFVALQALLAKPPGRSVVH